MTNDERLAWLNDMNEHLAKGGKLEFYASGNWELRGNFPKWNSIPEQWNRRQPDAQAQIDAAQEELRLCQQDAIKLQDECVALKAELAETRKVIEECRNALARRG